MGIAQERFLEHADRHADRHRAAAGRGELELLAEVFVAEVLDREREARAARARAMVEEFGRGVDGFEYQMLYGIRDAEQRRLADEGNHVRVYVPFGTQWYGYFVRRLAERPANLTFFLRALAERRH